MKQRLSLKQTATAALTLMLGVGPVPTFAQSPFNGFQPGNLVLSRSVYAGVPSTVTVGQQLPPMCPSTAKGCGIPAIADGTYPTVFNNNTVDGSFGVTSPILLDQITTNGQLVSTYNVDPTRLVTSFSSKSEIALNLSTDGSVITFMGYVAPVNALDVSNSNTPGVYDPTNPVGASYYRAVAQVNAAGNLMITDTNAYSGNNGRAAIYSNGLYYTTGNSNNGGGTPANVVAAGGAQLVVPGAMAGAPEQIGNFSITQVTNPATGMPYAADKLGKDNNFRGLTIFNNTLYVTKGSGSNGINTVYQVGNPGMLPTVASAPTAPFTILPGFPTTLAKAAGAGNPFGLFFANADTLYVADEGDGTAADAATSAIAGLQKWSLVNGTWVLDYVLQKGLGLGQQYSVPGLSSSLYPATDGIRNITGRVNSDGTVTIWGITSTISASGDQGADPNRLVEITDVLANATAAGAANEQFTTLRTANYAEVLRGVSFTPGTQPPPAPAQLPVTTTGFLYSRATHAYNGTITVLNNTSSAVSGPLVVVLNNLPSGVTLLNNTQTSGAPGVSVLGSGGSLAPGQSAQATVSFSNPGNLQITFTPVVEP